MSGLFAGTPLEQPVTCETCGKPLTDCTCPRDASGAILLPAAQTAIVNLEKRKKGKIITIISGLDPVASDLAALLSALKALCGCGGSLDGPAAAIELQGDQRDRACQHLESLGYKIG